MRCEHPPREHLLCLPPLPAAAWPLPAGLLTLGLGLLLGLLVAAGCQPSERAVRSTLPGGADAVAVVNNQPIPAGEFEEACRRFLMHWEVLIGDERKQRDQVRSLVLERMIDDVLMDQEAQRRGITVSGQEVQARARELVLPPERGRAAPAADEPAPVPAAWERELRERLLRQRLIQQEVLDAIRISDQEVRAEYLANRRLYYRPEQLHVRHIEVASRETYDKVLAALAQREDFVQLVRRYSISPDRAADGDLGFVQKGMLPPQFEQVILGLRRAGSYGGTGTLVRRPAQEDLGYHVFKLEQVLPAGFMSLEEAAPVIRRKLIQDREGAAYQRWLQNLRRNAVITINAPLLHGAAS